MLDEEEIQKIQKLIDQGKTNYRISKEVNHSPNTIAEIRNKHYNEKVNYTTGEETHFDDPIEEVRGIIYSIDNLIKNEHLKAGERKKWEKRRDDLKELLRTELDDKISSEVSIAIEERDNEWRTHIQKNYVQKEEVTSLNNKLRARDSNIESLNYAIDQKEVVLASIQQENNELKNQIRDLLRKNHDLNDKNLQLNYHIENRLDTDVGYWQEKLTSDQEALYVEKTNFGNYMKKQQSNLDKLYFDVNEKLKAVEIREEKNIEQEGKLKKRKADLDTDRTKMYDALEEKIKAMEKREENVTELEKGLIIRIDEQNEELDTKRKIIKDDQEKITQAWQSIKKTVEKLITEKKRLQEWQKLLNQTRGFNKFSLPCPHCNKPMLFDVNNQKTNQKINQIFGNYMHPECKLESEQQSHVILRPVSLRGKPVIHSGFPPIIQSGGEPIVVECSSDHVVRSGIFPTINSGEEVNVFGFHGEPVFQSGVST